MFAGGRGLDKITTGERKTMYFRAGPGTVSLYSSGRSFSWYEGRETVVGCSTLALR